MSRSGIRYHFKWIPIPEMERKFIRVQYRWWHGRKEFVDAKVVDGTLGVLNDAINAYILEGTKKILGASHGLYKLLDRFKRAHGGQK